MAWKKESDTAANHPIVTAPMTMVDWPERLTMHDFANLVWGVISRAATMSAGYRTDYLVTAGTLANLAGDNWRHWVAIAVKAGYLSPAVTEDGSEAWLLVEDSDDLFHIRRRAELEWETRRKKDNSTPSLIVPVRLRDGDACRYCGVIVNWNARRGGRAGTYDHREPGVGAQGPDDLRVACASCNGRRKDAQDAEAALPPLPPPAQPLYGEETAGLLAEHGFRVPLSNPPRPRTQRDTATPSDPAAGRITPPTDLQISADRPATPPPAGPRTAPPRPGNQPDHALEQHKHGDDRRSADLQISAGSADRRSTPVRNPGRDGNGSGSGREPPPVPATGRKRSRRGRPRPPQPPGKDHRGQGD